MTAIRTQSQLNKLIHSHGSIRNTASIRVLIASLVITPDHTKTGCAIAQCGERLFCYGTTLPEALEALGRYEQAHPRHIIIVPNAS